MIALRVFFTAGALVGIAGVLERIQLFGIRPGGVLCGFELIVGLLMSFQLLRSEAQRKEIRLLFVGAFLSLTLGDVIFFLVNYFAHENLLLSQGAKVASSLYALGFLLSSVALIKAVRFHLRSDLWKLVIPTVILFIAAGIYFLPLLFRSQAGSPETILSLGQNLNFVLSIVLGVVSLMVWVHSMSKTLVWVALGLSTLPLVNFFISSEILKKGGVDFGFPEYTWVFGVFLAEVGLIFWSSESFASAGKDHVRLVGSESLGVRYRVSSIGLVMLFLLGSIFFSNELSIEYVTLGLILSFIVVLGLSVWTVESIEVHSQLLGEHLEREWRRTRVPDLKWDQRLPVELELLSSTVFAQKLEGLRHERERSEKMNSLYRKLAHDIRSPLQALSHLLTDPHVLPEELRRSCHEAIGPMNRASDGILLELSSEVDGSSFPASPSVAIDLSGLVKRVLSIHENAARTRKDSVRWDIKAQEGPSFGWIDESAIERLLLNSLKNAGEAPGVTEGRIDVSRNQETIEVRVIDNGSGASTEVLSLLNRGVVHTTKKNGFGIGLTGMRERISAQGGMIEFSNHSEGGFEILLRVPRAPEKLILIEDDRAIQLAWRALARAREVNLEVLAPGSDILERLPEPPLESTEICVDLNLGDESGMDLLGKLQQRGYVHLTLVTSEKVSDEQKGKWKVKDKTFPRA